MNDERLFERLAAHAGAADVDPGFEDHLYAVLQREMRRTGRVSRPIMLLAAALLLAMAIGATALVGSGLVKLPDLTVRDRDRPVALPSASASADPSATPASSGSADVRPWTPVESLKYGFTFSMPPGWSITPAKHDWTLATDASNPLSSGQDVVSPGISVGPNDFRVGLWSVPVDRSATPETTAGVAAWIETYCEAAGTPCPDVETRAVPLCVEVWDCHPGLLVPFGDDAHAFLTGGIFGENVVVVAVYWGDSGSAVLGYGDSRRFLEAFLTTMDVWTADGAMEQRNPNPVP